MSPNCYDWHDKMHDYKSEIYADAKTDIAS